MRRHSSPARRALTTACFLLVATDANAYSLTLSPAVAALEIAAGDAKTIDVTVRADAQGAIPLVAYVWDYWHDGKGTRSFMPPGTSPRSASGWVEVVPRTLTLTDQAVTFQASVSVPPDASGGYAAMLFVQTNFGGAGEGASTVAEGRLGMPLLIRIAGTGTESMDVGEVTFTPPSASQSAFLSLPVHNTGDVHVQATFKGVLRTTDRDVLATVSSGEPGWVLPGERRELVIRWSREMEPGGYELVGTVLFGTDRAVPVVLPLIVSATEAPPTPRR